MPDDRTDFTLLGNPKAFFSYICIMTKKKNIGLDFVIDKLTNSIENIVTGDSFSTEISVVTREDLKLTTKKNNWVFNWLTEYKQPERELYKLTIVNNPNVIQGLLSVDRKSVV